MNDEAFINNTIKIRFFFLFVLYVIIFQNNFSLDNNIKESLEA